MTFVLDSPRLAVEGETAVEITAKQYLQILGGQTLEIDGVPVDAESGPFRLVDFKQSGETTERHYGPGFHPGTGSPQAAHAGKGVAGREAVIAQVQKLSAEAIARAHDREPQMTELMQSLAERSGGSLHGLEHNVKTEESLARKVREKMEEMGVDAETALEMITDFNRYTMIYSTDTYVENVKKTMEGLAAQGWRQYDKKYRNYFGRGDGYDGYNTVVMNDEGVTMEVQYHTPETIVIKEEAHDLYVVVRESKDPQERANLFRQMVDLWKNYTKPVGWESLPGELR